MVDWVGCCVFVCIVHQGVSSLLHSVNAKKKRFKKSLKAAQKSRGILIFSAQNFTCLMMSMQGPMNVFGPVLNPLHCGRTETP